MSELDTRPRFSTMVPTGTEDGDKIAVAIDDETSILVELRTPRAERIYLPPHRARALAAALTTAADEADPDKWCEPARHSVELVDGSRIEVEALDEPAAVLAAGARLGQDIAHLVREVELP